MLRTGCAQVYFGSWDGHIYKIRADTGEFVWRFFTGEPGVQIMSEEGNTLTDRVVSSPTIQDGILYAGSENGRLFALDTNGTEILDTFKFRDAKC